MAQIAVVTGAGSGVGQAVVWRLARAGWGVALVGRRAASLDETIRQAGPGAGPLLAVPCDISDQAAVEAMRDTVQARLGPVDVLVNAAGTNTPRRSLDQLDAEDYRRVVRTNLDGAFYCVQAFLPAMRERHSGTIVNIVSDAGLRANAKAGSAYVASKFGLAGLTESINAEERTQGIRACGIFPGDINTPLLEKRPTPPPADARVEMLQPEDIAECVWLAISLPPRAIVESLLVRPR
ncbi:MAG TPA: SDR family oxidoreductase [Chloroflexia bacterium]|jgi:NADP-dependent 3-hydroxy acid dehydrogenase YdfG|nr:SDR family oxidoreductase [Chloroflexia bacterium]